VFVSRKGCVRLGFGRIQFMYWWRGQANDMCVMVGWWYMRSVASCSLIRGASRKSPEGSTRRRVGTIIFVIRPKNQRPQRLQGVLQRTCFKSLHIVYYIVCRVRSKRPVIRLTIEITICGITASSRLRLRFTAALAWMGPVGGSTFYLL
jgi:hypothetical protein